MANIYDMSDTWNDAGTTFNAIKMNVTDTASAAGSLLMDLQVDGVSKAKLAKNAILNTSETGTLALIANRFSHGLYSVSGGCALSSGGNNKIWAVGAGAGATTISFMTSAAQPFTSGAILTYDAADTLAQRNSTNAQTFNLYNTYTDSSNYERASFTQTATGLVLDAQYLGTGNEPDNILELKSGGASKFKVSKAGAITATNLVASSWADANSRIFITSAFGNLRIVGNSTSTIEWSSSSSVYSTTDLIITRDAANTLAQRNGTNAQTFNLYNTYTDASNYERGFMKWNSDVLEIGTEAAGTGTARDVVLNGNNRVSKISDVSTGTDAAYETAINAIIDALEAHGLAASV